MQCPSCRAVYSNGLRSCPRCKTPSSKPSPESEARIIIDTGESTLSSTEAASVEAAEEPSRAPATSTLIEFPGVSRAQRPQWRKELSERVREIQERRSREAEEVAQRPVEQPVVETSAPQLGLVPQPEAPEVNPIVAAALKRLERARQHAPTAQRPRAPMGRGAAAAAAARVAEEQFEAETAKPLIVQTVSAAAPATVPSAKTEVAPQVKTLERERPLTVVQTTPKVNTEAARPQPKKVVTSKAQEVSAVTAEEEITDQISVKEFYDDRAPVMSRVAGSFIDLLVVAFASSPFAAIIELTNGNWADWRVRASMGGILVLVMFLYLTTSTALMGRTWGMSLVSLHPVDADTGMPPTTKQSVGRAAFYIASILALGLGILYALFDAEGRTVHDRLSSTAVVRD